MLNKSFWKKVFKQQADLNAARYVIISKSSDALHLAKQTIFALHRDDLKEAEEKLARSKKILIELDKQFGKDLHLRNEGSWKAGAEEFVEAKLFMDFCENKDLIEIKDFEVRPDEYIGGLSDVCGEIVRKMIGWTTEKKIAKVKKANQVINEIIHDLMQNNFTGYLRTKFDQAKRHLQKAESIIYDISIRKDF